MRQRMSEILLHFQSQQFEISGVAKYHGHIHVVFFVHLDPHSHIYESRNTSSHARFCHKGKLFHLVLEKLHLVIVLG